MVKDTLSLFELNNRVRDAVAAALPEEYWVHAEISSVNVNTAGHCYLELVQKNERGVGMVARARAAIWASRYRPLSLYFEKSTGQSFCAGISVRLLVTAEFHELYGFSYTVQDIDPDYTLGDMARRRREILLRLEEEGTLHMNKELEMPMVPRRVAVISSETAAGYGDFCNQLDNNVYGLTFHTRLFPAVMQGDRVEETVIRALDAIAAESEQWDVVVIIRGGGAAGDLVGFDTYDLAASCAQFPLPIITGIGHERDDTVIDAVAHTRVKTPTAAAAFLIDRVCEAADHLERCVTVVMDGIGRRLSDEKQRLTAFTQRMPAAVALLQSNEQHRLERIFQRMSIGITNRIVSEHHRVELAGKVLDGASPDNILRRGYSITLANGHAVRSASDLHADEVLLTRFADGTVYSRVLPTENPKREG